MARQTLRGFSLLLLLAACTAQGPQLYGGPQNAEEEELQRCLDITSTAGAACSLESDSLSLSFPRDSRELPTADQTISAISRMKAAGQPSPNCCENMAPYIEARCPCRPDYQQILPTGGFDSAYFEGATAILALACAIDFPPCSQGVDLQSASATPPPAAAANTAGR